MSQSTTPSPVETITFGRLQIGSDDRVLRPRAWTAAQSAWAAELLQTAPAPTVLEVCAGAGHIGLLAVADHPGATLVCVDLNPAACAWTQVNAEVNGLADRTEVREGRMDEVVGPGERFGLMIADPPWVPQADVGRFPEDPVTAIDGGHDGLDVARTCLALAARCLLPGASVLLQLGDEDQADRLQNGLDGDGPLRAVALRVEERGVLLRLEHV